MTNDDFVTRLRRLDCCAVSDAMDSLKLNGVLLGFHQLSTPRRIAGRVITVELVPAGSLPQEASRKITHLGTEAIETALPGDIIVIKQAPGSTAGCWGGILSLGASVRGVAGVIADGNVRDIDEAREYVLPVYGRGTTALTARGRVQQLHTNQPIEIGGITVHPGDLAIADGSGVAFIQAGEADRVLTAAERIATKEALMAKAVLSGKPIGDVMGADYEHLLN